MKNIFIFLFILLISIKCTAQSSVVNLTDRNGTRLTGVYYEDVNNILDNFIGTWVYSKDNTSFKIIIKKVFKAYNNVFYEDLLIGEYQYIEKGVEKINTFYLFDIVNHNEYQHSIDGNSIMENNHRPKCNDCISGEKRVKLGFHDPARQLGGELLLQRIIVNGQPALKAFKRTTTYAISLEEDSPYTEMLVPSGE